MLLQMATFSFLWLSSIPLCIYIYIYIYIYIHIFFIHSSVDRHLGHFHVLAIVNSAAMNITVHVSFWIIVLFEYMPRDGIAGSYGNSFLRNLYTVFHSISSEFKFSRCKRLGSGQINKAFQFQKWTSAALFLFWNKFSAWCTPSKKNH